MDPILDDLNPQQREAVEFGRGPLMVLAGAGSGKTRVITRRVARLLRDGVPSRRILALTFTNKAAGEMARRVEELGGSRVHVATFHSACARFLRMDGERLGYPRDFSIYDTYDRDACIKMLMQEHRLDKEGVKPAQVGRKISRIKNVYTSDETPVYGYSPIDRVVEKLFDPYHALMRKLGAMDFDDLIGRFVELLREYPDVAESYQQRFPWILVDEFQDTNRIQYDLLKRMTGSERSICVVGDPDQSIYKFRGAEIRNVLEFERDYEGAKIVRLEQNYRSTARILRGAEGVIANNEQRMEKQLFTDNDEGDAIKVHGSVGPAQEAREIARSADDLIRRGVSPSEIAVFYRSHFLSRSLEEGMREMTLPYQVVGGVSFFERREIKDLLAFMKVLVNPLDDVSMERIINVPARGIGKVSLEKLRGLAAQNEMSLIEVVLDPELRGLMPPRVRKGLEALATAMENAKALAPQGAHDALRAVADGVGYLAHIGDMGDPEDQARIENVAELHSDAAFFDKEIGGGLAGYLQHVSLMTSEDRQGEDGPRLSLMTIHAAKGLEFDHVFVAGLEDGLFPSARALDEGNEEEERRLMYVAMTRARKTLWLGHSESRMINGQLGRQRPSDFLREIPRDCVAGSISGGGGYDEWQDEDSGGDWLDPEPEWEHSQEEVVLASGLRVIHPVYGQGSVVTTAGQGANTKVTVDFDRSGQRVLLLEYAGLQVLPGENAG